MTTTEATAGTATSNGTRSERPMPSNVIQALARVMEELPGIGRNERSEQGYSYRGIEAITREAQSLLGRYGVVFVPKVLSRSVKEFSINSRPWTEDDLEVTYTVYGPGGVEDRIEVGPLHGLGRDNSDKGANKAMTQAFKYALIQTLCIGDAKDDPDRDHAHEADPHPTIESISAEERAGLRQRINAITVDDRKALGQWCDDQEIPRRTVDMSEAQIELVNEYLDRMAVIAAQDEPPADPSTGEVPNGPASPDEPPGTTPEAPDAATPPAPDEGPPATDTPPPAPEASTGVVDASGDQPDGDADPREAMLDEVIAQVREMPASKVLAELVRRAIEPPTSADRDEQRAERQRVLAERLFRERTGEVAAP